MPKPTLAIDGGEKAVRAPLPPMYPGGLRIGAEEEAQVLEVLRSKRLFRYYGPNPGPSKVAEFEKRFADRFQVEYALAVSSATTALFCALAALGIGPGDEVIVPAYTWISSAEAVMWAGAVPIVAEVDETLTLDPADAERRITPRTKAIMPVHISGVPCRMDELMAVARKHGLKVLEDVAQADGGSYRGRPLGSIADMGAFSFQLNKILTSGEGGMVTTHDRTLYDRALMMHDVAGGLRNKIPAEQIIPGLGFRMSELHGAVMLAQLNRLEDLLRDMRHHKAVLQGAIAETARRKGVAFREIVDEQGDTAISLTFFAPTAALAARISAALEAEGADAWPLYRPGDVDYHIYTHWQPLVHKTTHSERGGPWRWHEGEASYGPEQCPRSLDLLARAVHMDISPDLTSENVEELAEAINKVFEGVL